MPDKICPVCSNHAHLRLRKVNTDYHQCTNCRTIFSDPLDNSDMVGGGSEIPRNKEQNHLRIDRVNALCIGSNKSYVKVLDFGCGHGYLINDLRQVGYHCDGYDAYNEEFCKIPPANTYHIVTMIECIEHTSHPFAEIDAIWRSLIPGGVLMVESSYVEIADMEGIAYEDFFYIDPAVGHSTIFSWHGLDLLMALKGFKPLQHWNRHVRGFQKVKR